MGPNQNNGQNATKYHYQWQKNILLPGLRVSTLLLTRPLSIYQWKEKTLLPGVRVLTSILWVNLLVVVFSSVSDKSSRILTLKNYGSILYSRSKKLYLSIKKKTLWPRESFNLTFVEASRYLPMKKSLCYRAWEFQPHFWRGLKVITNEKKDFAIGRVSFNLNHLS